MMARTALKANAGKRRTFLDSSDDGAARISLKGVRSIAALSGVGAQADSGTGLSFAPSLHVRFGPKADKPKRDRNVRYVPIADNALVR
jgi:hypothetical protein